MKVKTIKVLLMRLARLLLSFLIDELPLILADIWHVIDAFNERRNLVDFPVFFSYLAVAFITYWVGCYSSLLLVSGVVFVAHGERRAQQRRQRLELRQAVEEADGRTLRWLAEYLRERAPLRPIQTCQDDGELEAVEWFNELLRQAWSHAEPYFKAQLVLLLEVLQQRMHDHSLAGLPLDQLMGLRMETFSLGTRAPVVKGVRVTKGRPDRNHFVLQADIVYSGDAEFVLASQKLKAGLRDLHIAGRVQLDLGPIITKMPLVAGLCIYMLEPPTIDFSTTSTASALDKLTREHLSKVIRSLLSRVLSDLMLMPNNLTVPFVDASSIRCPTPQGAVRVCVVEAAGVRHSDLLGRTDAYCVVSLGAEQSVTHCVKNSVSPCWVHWAQFVCTGEPGVGGPDLHFTVMDRDSVRADAVLLRLRLGTREVREQKLVDKWLDGGSDGRLRVQALWLSFTDDKTLLPVQMAEVAALHSSSLGRKERREGVRTGVAVGTGRTTVSTPVSPSKSGNLFSCVLLLWLDSAYDLPESSGNWRVQVAAGGSTQHSWAASQPAHSTAWAWKQSFLFQLASVHENLNLKIRSHDGFAIKGHLNICISNLLECSKLTTGNKKIKIELSTGKEASIKLDCSLKILHPAEKAMEDLKVINRKLRETTSTNTARDLIRKTRSASKNLLVPVKNDGGGESSTFYIDSNSASPESPLLDVPAFTSVFKFNSPKSSRKYKTLHSASHVVSTSNLLQNIHVSDSDVKLRVQKQNNCPYESRSDWINPKRMSMSLEDMTSVGTQKEDGLITKSLKRIRNTTKTRRNVRDVFSSNNLQSAFALSSSSQILYGIAM